MWHTSARALAYKIPYQAATDAPVSWGIPSLSDIAALHACPAPESTGVVSTYWGRGLETHPEGSGQHHRLRCGEQLVVNLQVVHRKAARLACRRCTVICTDVLQHDERQLQRRSVSARAPLTGQQMFSEVQRWRAQEIRDTQHLTVKWITKCKWLEGTRERALASLGRRSFGASTTETATPCSASSTDHL